MSNEITSIYILLPIRVRSRSCYFDMCASQHHADSQTGKFISLPIGDMMALSAASVKCGKIQIILIYVLTYKYQDLLKWEHRILLRGDFRISYVNFEAFEGICMMRALLAFRIPNSHVLK